MFEPATRSSLSTVIARLDYTLALAKSAAGGAEPETAAHYILDTREDLGGELETLRSVKTGARRSRRAS